MLNTGKLAGKVVFITGASRGIGKSIALKAAKDGAKVVVAAKTAEPHPKLPGTIYTAAEEIEAAGGQALPCIVDVRNESQVQSAVEEAVSKFGGIDVVVNDASAISLTGTWETPMKTYDLMHDINTRGTYLVTKTALPYLKASRNNPHVLNIAPPLSLNPRWFRDHVAYTMAKYGMSMCVLGMAEEFKGNNIAVNALWPKTAIITAAMEMLGGPEVLKQCRTPQIMADAAYVILNRDSRSFTGNFSIDEAILKEEGCSDFSPYLAVPGTPESHLLPDFFLDELAADPQDVLEAARGASKPRFVGGKDVSASTPSSSSSSSPQGTGKSIQAVFDKIGPLITDELIQKVQCVYKFRVKGEEESTWYIDLKNPPGASGACKPGHPADVTFTIKEKGFHELFEGELSSTAAFMSGQLRISGDMTKAMKLQKVMGVMRTATRSYHTLHSGKCFSVERHPRPILGSLSPVINRTHSTQFNTVDEIFERVKTVANKEMVNEVNATFVFDVEEDGKFYIDLKEGDGSAGPGDFSDRSSSFKPDVSITMNRDNTLKLFNRELAPATAFMSGKLKLSGDLTKAMSLQKVMNASADSRQFHTSTTQLSEEKSITYSSVDDVRDRIKSVASKKVVDEVGAIYFFDVDDDTGFYVDFKHGEGDVGEGEPPADKKPDVTIKMKADVFLKIFNREIPPATAFMTGKVKICGDLSKALTLEKVMKAAREGETAE